MGLVVDLLCFCVVSHSYRIKYYVLRNNVVEKVCVRCLDRGGGGAGRWGAGGGGGERLNTYAVAQRVCPYATM